MDKKEKKYYCRDKDMERWNSQGYYDGGGAGMGERSFVCMDCKQTWSSSFEDPALIPLCKKQRMRRKEEEDFIRGF